MALIVPVAASATATKQEVVETDAIRVRRVLFDLDQTACIAVVCFGTGGEDDFVEVDREYWFLRGEFYKESISVPPTGTTSAEVTLTGIYGVINAVQADPSKKFELLGRGELEIVEPLALLSLLGS